MHCDIYLVLFPICSLSIALRLLLITAGKAVKRLNCMQLLGCKHWGALLHSPLLLKVLDQLSVDDDEVIDILSKVHHILRAGVNLCVHDREVLQNIFTFRLRFNQLHDHVHIKIFIHFFYFVLKRFNRVKFFLKVQNVVLHPLILIQVIVRVGYLLDQVIKFPFDLLYFSITSCVSFTLRVLTVKTKYTDFL